MNGNSVQLFTMIKKQKHLVIGKNDKLLVLIITDNVMKKA
jgi:hypothetical protein